MIKKSFRNFCITFHYACIPKGLKNLNFATEPDEKIILNSRLTTQNKAAILNSPHNQVPVTAHDNFDHNASRHWQDTHKRDHITLVYQCTAGFSQFICYFGTAMISFLGMYCGPAAIVIFFMVTQHFSTKNVSKAFVLRHPGEYWDRM